MIQQRRRALSETQSINNMVLTYCRQIQADWRAQEQLGVAPTVLRMICNMSDSQRDALQVPILAPNTLLEPHVWARTPAGDEPRTPQGPDSISQELRALYQAMLVFVRDVARHNRLHCQQLLSVPAGLAETFAGWTVSDVATIAQTTHWPLFVVRQGQDPMLWARLCALDALEPRLANMVNVGMLLNVGRAGNEAVLSQTRCR